MHRARIAVEDGGDIEEVDRRVVHLALAGIGELTHEIAQPEALGVDRRHGFLASQTRLFRLSSRGI